MPTNQSTQIGITYYWVALKMAHGEVREVHADSKTLDLDRILSIATNEGIYAGSAEKAINDLIAKWNLNLKRRRSPVYWYYSLEKPTEPKIESLKMSVEELNSGAA